MSELIKDLRQLPDTYEYDFDEDAIQTCNEAANKIIELEGIVSRLEKRLKG